MEVLTCQRLSVDGEAGAQSERGGTFDLWLM